MHVYKAIRTAAESVQHISYRNLTIERIKIFPNDIRNPCPSVID